MSIRRNLFLFKLNSFFAYMWPLSAVAIIYFERISGSYALASSVFSLFVLTQSLAELPTGVVSDQWSRRKTMMMSGVFWVLSGVSFALAGNFNSTLLLFVGAVCWGIGDAFSSGTDEALMYETMQDLRKKQKYDMVFAEAKIYRYLGAAAATGIAVPVIYFLNLNWLAWVSVLPAAAQLIVSFYFAEPKSYHRQAENAFVHFINAIKNFWKNKNIQQLAAAQVLNHSWGETQYRLNSLYFNLFVPVWAVDLVVFIYRICSSAGFYLAIFLRRIGLLKMVYAASIFKFVLLGLGLLLNNMASPFIMAGSSLATGGEHSAESALLQKEFSDAQRATMRSIVAVFDGLLTALTFWFFGWLADVYSVYAALAALLAYKFVIICYYGLLVRKFSN